TLFTNLIPNIKFLFYLTTVSLLSFSLILVEYKSHTSQIFKINKKRIISGVQKRDTMRLIDYKISCLFFSN
ncbi:TPA: hypothetical protein ACOKVT_000150, partial [Streptococcus pneumoniae]